MPDGKRDKNYNRDMPKITKLNEIAKRQGFKLGDDVLRIGGYKMVDELDYLYYDNEKKFSVDILRDGKEHTIKVHKKDGQSLGLEFAIDMKPVVCKNKCIFCFVDQLPKNMRPSLYVKDDDYRYSFMCGSYVTMTNVTKEEIERVIRLKLSPLYISVHAWDDDIRTYILKNPNTRKLPDQMRRLGANGIKMHTQLVVVPDVNDGKVLEDSIRGLHTVEGVETVAVVPVGMTGHREQLAKLKAVDEQNARDTIKLVEGLNEEFGGNFCWCSDEYYVKANVKVPDGSYYGAFDQIENGVGLIADWIDNFEYSLQEAGDMNLGKRIDMVTGVSFAPMLKEYSKKLAQKLGLQVEVHAIINNFFGTSVTVAGLVTAGDMIEQLQGVKTDAFVIPDNMLREFTDTFLDNKTVKEVEDALGAPFIVVSHSGSDTAQKIIEHFEK